MKRTKRKPVEKKKAHWPPRFRVPKNVRITVEEREPDKSKEAGGRVDVPMPPCEEDE